MAAASAVVVKVRGNKQRPKGGFIRGSMDQQVNGCLLYTSISQEKLPLDLGFFQFVHNARIRGAGLLRFLLELLVA